MNPLNLLQITDTHLFKSKQQTLCGLRTFDAFKHVVQEAKKKFRPDVVLVTGDISQDMSPASYQSFKKIMNTFRVPVLCCPGNHDSGPTMKSVLNEGRVAWKKFTHHKNWNFILLNSTIPRSTDGQLRPSELSVLKKTLKKYPQHPTLIAMHHHILPTRSMWMDRMIVKNANQFLKILKGYPHVKAVVTGHVHQVFQKKRKGVLFLASPSTCIQFRPKNSRMGLDRKNPGYRWIKLFPNGRITTAVKRVQSIGQKPDYTVKGY